MLRISALALGVLLLATIAPTSGRAADLCRIEPESQTVLLLSNLSRAAAPTELRVEPLINPVSLSSDRRRLFMPTDKGLSVLDLKRLQVTDTIPIEVGAHYVVGSDDTLYVYERDDAGTWLRIIDLSRRTEVGRVALPDDAIYAETMSIGDNGRLLYIITHNIDSSDSYLRSGIVVVDLRASRLISNWVAPSSHTWMGDAQANPTHSFAYAVESTDDGSVGDRVWLLSDTGDRKLLAIPSGRFVFSPDGSRACVVRNRDVDGPDRTVLVDTDGHTAIADLPSGEIVGFAANDCVIVTDGRQLRRACPGATRSLAIESAMLSPANTPLVDVNTYAVPAWTTGPCQAPPSGCEDGVACLEIAGARGAPGESVEIAVRLHTAGADIAGTQNDLYLDRALWLPLVDADTPVCEINPDIVKPASTVACRQFVDGGCVGTRALVFSLVDLDPIPDGSLLYRCTVHIPDGAPVGHYRIGCANADAATPSTDPLPLRCQESEIVVVPAESGLAAQNSTASSDGCQIAPGTSTAPAAVWWIPLMAAAAISVRRRRSDPSRR